MSIEPATVNSLNLKIATKTNFSFQIRKTRAAIGAQSLRNVAEGGRPLDRRVLVLGLGGARLLGLAGLIGP